MTGSILNDVKKMLGITSEYTDFDVDIIAHINSVFFVLRQLGVGPKDGYSISSAANTWSELQLQNGMFDSVKSYVFLKVKSLFDPSASSSVQAANDKLIAELEWRLNVSAESNI